LVSSIARVAGIIIAAALAALAPYQHAQRLVDIGDRRLNVYCAGTGSPSVVLESGLGTGTDVWHLVQPKVARTNRVCSYDRAGLGFSDPGPHPRSADLEAIDLHALLHDAGIPGPYVLVGHALGSFVTELYASLYSSEVAGMVLVDPMVNPRPFDTVGPQMKNYYHSIQQNYQKCAATSEHCRTALSEITSYNDGRSLAEVRDADRGYNNLPLVVLTATGSLDFLGTDVLPAEKDAFWKIWNQQHTEIAGESSIGVNIVVPHSGQNVPLDQPNAVVSAIGKVISEARLR